MAKHKSKKIKFIIITIFTVIILSFIGILAIGLFLNRNRLLVKRSNSAEKPNILWIIAEDMGPELGCYGTELIYTPHLDKLASEGVLFTHAYTTAPVCSASRSAIITGMYQTSIDAHNHRSHRNDGYKLPKPIKLLTYYFNKAGYFTSNSKGLDWEKPGKKDFNFNVWSSVEKTFDGTDWNQREFEQPFFAQINFYETHRTFVRDTINPIDPDKIKLSPYYPDHPISRKDWALYLETIQVLDRKVGKVLKRLEDEGLEKNTIVFFFADNGRPFPRGKQFLYEGGIHIPLIIRWPEHIKPGIVVEDLISAIDFAPTSLKLAGITPPKYMQGQTFLGPDLKKRGYIIAARDRIDEAVDRIRCVRTERFKYIRNYYTEIPYTQFHGYVIREHPIITLLQFLKKLGKLTVEQEIFMSPTKPEEELYDLVHDPYELKNLARESKYEKVLIEFRRTLDKWIENTDDRGIIPEDQEFIQDIKENKKEKHESIMKERGLSPDISPEDYIKWWEEKLNQQNYQNLKEKNI